MVIRCLYLHVYLVNMNMAETWRIMFAKFVHFGEGVKLTETKMHDLNVDPGGRGVKCEQARKITVSSCQ